jgi:DNA-binding response OmpR family regulator
MTKDPLENKKVLVVDDEPDVLETVGDLLHMCEVDKARDREGALTLLRDHSYDAAILDIMGVHGYDLLEETKRRGIPTLMLTANALSPDDFFKSIHSGADAYVPKDRLADIAIFLRDVLEAQSGHTKRGTWFKRLEAFFEERFEADWRERENQEFWKKYFYV